MPVSVRGVVYPSHKAAAKALGIGPSAISQRLRKTGSADTCGLSGAGGVIGNKNAAKSISIAGVHFASRDDAARSLGISRYQLKRWTSPNATEAMRQMLIAAIWKADIKLLRDRSGIR